MKLNVILFSGLFLFINALAIGQSDPVLQRIVEIGRTDNQSMQHLDILCNRFGGRLIGSDAYENAAIWHTERDLYNKSIPEYQEHTAIATAVLVYGLANLDHLLSREGYYLEPAEAVEDDKKSARRKKR